MKQTTQRDADFSCFMYTLVIIAWGQADAVIVIPRKKLSIALIFRYTIWQRQRKQQQRQPRLKNPQKQRSRQLRKQNP
ncbi:MAG: hypothetical protein IKL98_07520, partial [Akkermansia sp.]|nr:hypothetical protein [Akkermansia sp.]